MNPERENSYLTPKEFSEKYPTFTKTWMRHRLWRRAENGLDKAVVKVGRKFFIHEERFFEWIESHGGK